MKYQLKINGQTKDVDVDPMTPLLWVVRDELQLKGTKFGCGRALCGACSLHVGDDVIRSCSFPIQLVEDKEITTIEGLSADETHLHPVQQAWLDIQVPQCGYCQPGFMMAAAKLLDENPNPTEQDIKDSITNICRCGTHPRIIKAILKAAELKKTMVAS